MRAGERLVGQDGKEVMLFPLSYMYISQGEGGIYSHAGTYNIDFLGYDENGRVYGCPYYAPCSCTCVWAGGVDNIRIYQSNDEVHRGDGTVGYATFLTMHDNNPIASVGDSFTQGDLIGHTGTAGNVTGDHLHLNTARGTYQGFYDVGTGHYQLRNSTHVYNTCYVNDTNIIRGFNHNWRTYTGPTPDYRKYKFKFVLYANKLRNRNVA